MALILVPCWSRSTTARPSLSKIATPLLITQDPHCSRPLAAPTQDSAQSSVAIGVFRCTPAASRLATRRKPSC